MAKKRSDSPAPTRGRPRSFELDHVVDAAMLLFWRDGYEDTNLADITAATGVNPSSLYAAFGNKHGLFRAALERYQHHVDAALETLASESSGVDDVIAFIEWVRTWIISAEQPNGCLFVNTMVEFAGRDADIAEAATRYREHFLSSIQRALQRAEQTGEIGRGSGSGRAFVVQAGLFGALATGRSGAVDQADKMLHELTAEVDRWRAQT